MDGSKQWQENLRHLSARNFELNFEATTIKSRRKGIDPVFPRKERKGRENLFVFFPLTPLNVDGGKKRRERKIRRGEIFLQKRILSGIREGEKGSDAFVHLFFRNLLIYSTNSLRFMECKLSTILFPLGWTVACNASIYHPEIDGNRSFLFETDS